MDIFLSMKFHSNISNKALALNHYEKRGSQIILPHFIVSGKSGLRFEAGNRLFPPSARLEYSTKSPF